MNLVLTRLFPFLLATALLSACGGPPATSGYGIAWVTLQSEPGNFAAYVATIDSVTLTRNDGVVVTAIGTPEVVDFTQISRVTEMWGSGAIPIGTYVAATITLDYTSAVIAVKVNGKPQKATVHDASTNTVPSTYTYSITVNFDPANQLVVTPTFASTSAHLLAIDMDLAASGTIDYSTSPATVLTQPYLTVGVQRPDTRLIRIRGPLINSASNVDSYSVYVRPFYDEANNIGAISLFGQANTVWTLNGQTYRGPAGLAALSQLSAGITMTAGYTEFIPDYNPANQAYAGTFYLDYVVGASTLEDEYTEGISGDVIARNGDTLTLQNSILFLNTADEFEWEASPTQVLLGPGTIVTADDNTTLGPLDSSSVAVGQHVTARGLYSVNSAGTVVIDSTGTSATNTGSVRLQTTELYGPLVSTASGSLTMDLEYINGWPVSDYDLAGNGAVTPSPASFLVTTGALAPPAGTAAGDPVWVDGFFAPFGSAPPDFTAVAVNNEASVQVAVSQVGGGTPYSPGPAGVCAADSQVCDPATLEVLWSGKGTTAPFLSITSSDFILDLASVSYATISIGPEVTDVAGSSTLMIEGLSSASYAEQALTFAPRYSWGVPTTATTTTSVTSTTELETVSDFATFTSKLSTAASSTYPAQHFTAHGVWNRSTNVFTAASIDFVF